VFLVIVTRQDPAAAEKIVETGPIPNAAVVKEVSHFLYNLFSDRRQALRYPGFQKGPTIRNAVLTVALTDEARFAAQPRTNGRGLISEGFGLHSRGSTALLSLLPVRCCKLLRM